MDLHTPLLGLALAVSACGSDAPRQDASASGTRQSSALATEPTQQMPGMPGLQGDGTADQVQAQLQIMQGALQDALRAMLPAHRQKAANMLAEFDREMREMNVSSDAVWNATVDSLRQDLVADAWDGRRGAVGPLPGARSPAQLKPTKEFPCSTFSSRVLASAAPPRCPPSH